MVWWADQSREGGLRRKQARPWGRSSGKATVRQLAGLGRAQPNESRKGIWLGLPVDGREKKRRRVVAEMGARWARNMRLGMRVREDGDGGDERLW